MGTEQQRRGLNVNGQRQCRLHLLKVSHQRLENEQEASDYFQDKMCTCQRLKFDITFTVDRYNLFLACIYIAPVVNARADQYQWLVMPQVRSFDRSVLSHIPSRLAGANHSGGSFNCFACAAVAFNRLSFSEFSFSL